MLSLDYIAGFFDGEGNVSVHLYSGAVSIGLTQVKPEVLREIAEMFPGGNLTCRVRINPKWADCYNLVWCGLDAKPFLEAIVDKVRIKQERVKIGVTTAQIL